MASGTLSSTPGPGPTSTQTSQQSWEGDKMFNIYIYDYCNKRGFRETAQKLMVEAEIAPDSTPPINAKQGLLFEWWSVFWVLFTAKSSGSGTEDAMVYIQQQQSQAQQRQTRMQPQQQSMGRFPNGIQRQPGAMPLNGSIPNGVTPASLQAAQGHMSNGAPSSMSFPMTGSAPQQNGILVNANGPPAVGSSPQPQQGFQSMLSGHRPGGPQQRGPGPQFQSPTMSHSTQNPGTAPGQPPPMGQLGPSPHTSHVQRGGNMLPPNGAQGAQQAPNPTYQQRPPSRTASPSNIMTQPSPSMAARQPPSSVPSSSHEAAVNNELTKIPPNILTLLRQETGLADRELSILTLDEKQRLVMTARQRTSSAKPGPPGVNNAVAGPSVPVPNQRNQQRQGAPQQQLRGNKRNSTSPGEEHETLPGSDTSPPDRKRTRRSPLNAEQASPMNSMNYSQPSPQGGQGGGQQMSNGMVRSMGTGMNGFPQGGMQNMGNSTGMNIPMGQPMGPQMGGPQGMMTQQQMAQIQQQQYRQSMHHLHKTNLMAGNAASPTSGDFNGNGSQGRGPQFAGNGAPDHRTNQNKSMGMLPPPSPAGALKDQSGQNKDKGGPSTSSNRSEGSPRNQHPNPGQGTSNAGNSGQSSTAPPTPNNVMTAPSPSAILVNTPTGMNPPGQPMAAPPSDISAIFGNADFISSMGPLPMIDGFDDATLSKSFDVDFERDFGQWFNPENDVTGALDPK